MDYITLKWLHVLSSTVLFGTGIGSAFYLLFTTFSRDVRAIASVTRTVVVADWLFTSTTAVLQPLTGLWMMHIAGMPWRMPWIAWSLGLYAFAIACWLPVVWIQLRLRDHSGAAAAAGSALPPVFWRLFIAWVVLGALAFVAFLLIFYLMVAKRLPWAAA
jgi:uncharacterized membrane protein